MIILKNNKNNVFINRNGEHIVGYLIHLNKNKTNKTGNQYKIGAN
jgi:hypothetical protein